MLVGVPLKDDEFRIHPLNFLNNRTLKGTFCGDYRPWTDLTNLVDMYIKGGKCKVLFRFPLSCTEIATPPRKCCSCCG